MIFSIFTGEKILYILHGQVFVMLGFRYSCLISSPFPLQIITQEIKENAMASDCPCMDTR